MNKFEFTVQNTQIGADLLPQYGEYLLYSERERDRKAANPAAKREGKKRKLIAKEKQNAQEFEAALGRMGLDFDSEGSAARAGTVPSKPLVYAAARVSVDASNPNND